MTDTTTGFTRLKPVQPAPTGGFTKLKPVTKLSSTPPATTPTPSQTGNPMLDFQEDTNFQPEGQAPKGLTIKEAIADPVRMGKVRKMMMETKDGQKWATAPNEEVFDSFMNHMRWFNANEFSTAAELIEVYTGSDEEKITRGEAYKVYDELSSMWTNNPTPSGVADALLDYTKASIPGIIAGVGIGKVAGSVFSRAGAKAAQKAAIEAAEAAAKTTTLPALAAAKGGVAKTRAWPRGTTVKTVLGPDGKFVSRSVTSTKTAKQVAAEAGTTGAAPTAAVATKINGIVDATTTMIVKKSAQSKTGGVVNSELVKSEVRNFVTQGAAKAQVAGVLAYDIGSATLQDIMYQQVMLGTDVQDNYSLLQTGFSALASTAGSLPAIGILQKSKGTTLGNAGELVRKSYEVRAKVAREKAGPRIKSSFTQFASSWKQMAEAGAMQVDDTVLDEKLFNWFFDINDENSVFRILVESGAEISADTGRLSQDVINAAYGMGDEALAELNEAFKTVGLTFGEHLLIANKILTERTRDAAGNELMDAGARIAATARRQGQGQNVLSQAAKFRNAIQGASAAKRNATEIVLEAAAKEAEDTVNGTDYGRYFLSFLKKTLTANPVTTVVNVKGWSLAQASTALANITTATALMGRAGGRAVFDWQNAGKDIGLARHYVTNQTFLVSNLVDPFMTAEAFYNLLENAPTKTKKTVAGQLFGGVDNFTPEAFGVKPESWWGKKLIDIMEGYASGAQAISFVHVQNTLTVAQTGMQELDMQVRLKLNKSLTQLIADGEFYKVDVDMWDKVGQAALRATFSEDLSKGNHLLKDMAGAIQKISNNPVLAPLSGILFGNFINSVIAFTYRHSPFALLPALSKVFKSGADETASQALSRAVVGTAAWFYFLPKNEAEKQADGLQWFEERNEDGSISNVSTLFPKSLFNLVGRINHNLYNGQGMDIGLVDDLNKQLVIMDALENAGAPGWLQEGARFLANPRIPLSDKQDFAGIIQEFGSIGLNAGSFVANEAASLLVSGPMRPLANLNQVISSTYPEAGGGMVADVKQAQGLEKIALSGSRNISSFFNFFFGEETGYGTRLYGKPRESALQDGPVRMANPMAQLQGEMLQPPRNAINKVLAMVDKQPFRAESFTTGVPEWDAFMNKTVTPLLEQEAQALLNNELFLKAPHSAKMDRVSVMLTKTRQSVIDLVEGGYIGDANTRLLNARRTFVILPVAIRQRARIASGVKTPDRQLSLTEIEKLRLYIEMDKDKYKLK